MVQFDEKNDLNLFAFYFLPITLMVSLVLTIIVCCAKKNDANKEGDVEAQLPSEKASNDYIETIPNESPPKLIEPPKPKEPTNFVKPHDYQTLMGIIDMSQTFVNKPKPAGAGDDVAPKQAEETIAYNVITDSKRKEMEYKATHKETPPPPPTDIHEEAQAKEPVRSAPQIIKPPTVKSPMPTEKLPAQYIATILMEKATKPAKKMNKPAGKITVPVKKTKQSHADIRSKYIEICESAMSKSPRLQKAKSKSGSENEKRKVPTKIPQPNYLTVGVNASTHREHHEHHEQNKKFTVHGKDHSKPEVKQLSKTKHVKIKESFFAWERLSK